MTSVNRRLLRLHGVDTEAVNRCPVRLACFLSVRVESATISVDAQNVCKSNSQNHPGVRLVTVLVGRIPSHDMQVYCS